VVVVIGAAIASATAYAYTAGGTAPATHAGFGTRSIGAYTVSGASYTLNATSPQDVDSVQLSFSGTLPTAGTTVKVQLYAGGPFHACGAPSGGSVTCTTSGETAVGATQLTVVAVN